MPPAMALYFFHIRTSGVRIADDEGVDLRDLRAAHDELLASAQDLAVADMSAGHDIADDSIEMEDASGHLIEIMPIRRLLH